MNLALAAFAVGLSGFVALSYEIVWYRVLTIASGGAAAAFGLLLAFYLAGLAIGARLSGTWCERTTIRPSDQRVMIGVFAFFLLANATAALVLPGFAWTSSLGVWSASLFLVAIAAGLLGCLLPLATYFAVPADHRAGAGVAYLYAANIAGSVTGSFVTGFVLLDLVTTPTLASLLLACGCAAASILLLLCRPPRQTAIVGIGVAAALSLAGIPLLRAGFGRYYERLLYGKEASSVASFAQVVENRSGVIMVTPDGIVYGTGAYDGRVSTDLASNRNMISRAYAVAGLHPAPRSVLMIGLGGGAWAQVVANHPAVEHMTIVEINPGYTSVIKRHPEVASLLSNPRVDFIIDDGRRWLSRHPDSTYDLIVANTMQHWRPHATNLLSREYLRLIRPHLKPGGVYYFNTTYSPAVIRTAMTEYPHGVRVLNFAAVSDSTLTFDRERLRRVLREYRIDGHPVVDATTDGGRATLQESVDSLDVEDRASVLANYGSAPIVTDDNMYPEWHPSAQEWPHRARR